MRVQFDTKVWEGDYRTALEPSRLEAMITRNQWDFERRLVVINNVERVDVVARRCRRLVRAGVIDDFVVAAELAGAALEGVGLTADELGAGYKYSIAELVALHVSRSELVLHFAGDSMLDAPHDWLGDAVTLLGERDDVAAVNLVWNHRLDQVRAEAEHEDATFCYSRGGFSDQMYLVRTADFRARIYHQQHPASDRYPTYGGELFEKRVDSWMRTQRRWRAVWTGGSYEHRNIAPHRPLAARLVDRFRPG